MDGLKPYYRMKEAAQLLKEPAYVIRYWEKVFKCLNIGRQRNNHRVFDKKTMQKLITIKNLSRTEKYTLEGIKRQLRLQSKRGYNG